MLAFDPETADKLHPNNRGRIIRAIECIPDRHHQSEAVRRSKLKKVPMM